jgi:hypothetical protein
VLVPAARPFATAGSPPKTAIFASAVASTTPVGTGFPTLTKFFDTKRPDLTYEPGSRDYFVFRLADVYLMLAEAQMKAGNMAEATAAINVVRQRAAWPGKKDAMLITPAQMTMEFLMQERARELAGEQTRWMDLKRWGNLVERVKLYNPQAAGNVKDIHNLRPIPQTQILLWYPARIDFDRVWY